MNKKMLARMTRRLIRLWPAPIGLTRGCDRWIIDSVSQDSLRLMNIHTGHIFELGYDHIKEWRSGLLSDGFLCLRSRVWAEGNRGSLALIY